MSTLLLAFVVLVVLIGGPVALFVLLNVLLFIGRVAGGRSIRR